MTRHTVGLSLRMYGMLIVSIASMLLIVSSFLHAWQLPVTAISGIAPYSDIVAQQNGKVLRPPEGRHAIVDLQPGDYILEYDGVTWDQAQRLNLVELSERQVGDLIPLWVKRGDEIIKRGLPVTMPGPWERLVLLIPVISAVICWFSTTFLLWTLSRELRGRSHRQHQSLIAYQGSISLWFLTWQAVSIAQSLSSLKYPVALLCTEALIPLIALLVAITSFPYPLAPQSARPSWFTWTLFIIALLTAAVIVWYSFQSPFTSVDWRRDVQVVRSTDIVGVWTRAIVFVGVAIAGLAIFAATSFMSFVEALQSIAYTAPRKLQYLLLRVAQTIETIYAQCPASLKVIARFQLTIVLVYLAFDLIPRLTGEGSGGYSVLFAAIPLSYLLLWSDVSGQEQVWRGMNIMVGLVLLIQIPNLVYRFLTSGGGSNIGDIMTILFVVGGTLLGGLALAIEQWRRQRAAPDALPQAIDELFNQQNQEHFWAHLVYEVGNYVGVRTWLWLVSYNTGPWGILATTQQARQEWLDHAGVQAALSPPPSQPVSVVVEHYDLPTTLILLPIYRDQHRQEILIAANPQWMQGGIRLLDPTIAGRLKDAVSTLRFIEQQQDLALQQQRLAEERFLRAEAYRQLERKQAGEARSASLIAFAMLHNDVLQRLPIMADTMRRMARRTSDDTQRDQMKQMVDDVVSIDVKIRDILQDLRVRVAREQLTDTVQDMVDRLRQQHPTITFVTRMDVEVPPLNDAQRDLVFLMVQEALENAIEHATPTTVRLVLYEEDACLTIEVEDDGAGFVYDERKPSPTSLGLLLMHDLSEALDGSFAVRSAPGAGCCVRLRIPLDGQGVAAGET